MHLQKMPRSHVPCNLLYGASVSRCVIHFAVLVFYKQITACIQYTNYSLVKASKNVEQIITAPIPDTTTPSYTKCGSKLPK